MLTVTALMGAAFLDFAFSSFFGLVTAMWLSAVVGAMIDFVDSSFDGSAAIERAASYFFRSSISNRLSSGIVGQPAFP